MKQGIRVEISDSGVATAPPVQRAGVVTAHNLLVQTFLSVSKLSCGNATKNRLPCPSPADSAHMRPPQCSSSVRTALGRRVIHVNVDTSFVAILISSVASCLIAHERGDEMVVKWIIRSCHFGGDGQCDGTSVGYW